MSARFTRRLRLPVPAEDVFRWHARPGALMRLNPPWAPARLVRDDGSLEPGSQVVLQVPMGPFRRTWVAEHTEYVEGRRFRDVQRSGPFALWDHTHDVIPDPAGGCSLVDDIEYRPPFGALGRWLGGAFLRRQLDRTFQYRHRILERDLGRHASSPEIASMNVIVSGSTGLVGSALVPFLTTGGHSVTRLVRGEAREGEVRWDPASGRIDAEALEGRDAVVHLAGENIASRRWSTAQKARIRDSRVDGTRLLCEALAGLQNKPKVLVCASAIGFYGDRGDDLLDESASSGDGFLAETCREWEAAVEPARAAGIRVVNLRFGVILSAAGGALAKMLTPFKLGAGGRLGDGRQFMSWIALDDAVAAVHHALATEALSGPVNAVAPQPVTNAEFTRVLGRVLSRPTIFPMPAFAARLVFGEMGDELLLASTRVSPGVLMDTGFAFDEPELEGALRHLLGKTAETVAKPTAVEN